MKRIELLAPAGNLEKLKYAIHFGADAVYCGIPDFSLRVRINQFGEKDIAEAAACVHKYKKKIYITLNIYAHNCHLPRVEKHLKFLKNLEIDGVIVSDPGIINLVKKHLPKVDIHLSTQANTTNWQAVKFWADQGVKRIILAREVTLAEIKEIKKHSASWRAKVELEYFVHGAMCMSYSGRCILSKWMNNRSANLGDCTQPCRWKYKTIEEDKERFKIDLEEDKHGTYFFNSYDLNLIEYVDKLVDAGVDCLKIEGRAKSAYYVAIVTRAYRKALNSLGSKNLKKTVKEQKAELDNLVNRGYTTGFLLGKEPEHNFSGIMKGGKWKFVGEIAGNWEERGNKGNTVKIHNEIYPGDKIEAITPEKNIPVKIIKIYDNKMQEISEAHGGHERQYYFAFDKLLPERSLIRKKLK